MAYLQRSSVHPPFRTLCPIYTLAAANCEAYEQASPSFTIGPAVAPGCRPCSASRCVFRVNPVCFLARESRCCPQRVAGRFCLLCVGLLAYTFSTSPPEASLALGGPLVLGAGLRLSCFVFRSARNRASRSLPFHVILVAVAFFPEI